MNIKNRVAKLEEKMGNNEEDPIEAIEVRIISPVDKSVMKTLTIPLQKRGLKK